jgi:SAM-dependent methyltransferase
MSDSQHFENPLIWKPEPYAQQAEQNRLATCVDLIPDSARSLLDVGCGNGAFLAFLESQHRRLQLMGLERSQAAIDAALCRTPIYRGEVNTLPFPDHTFDVVSAMEVIEHLPFGVYEQSLRELERVASQYILISVPYRDLRVPVRCPYCGCEFNPYYHVRSFDEHNLAGIFQQFRRVRSAQVMADDFILGNLVRKVYRTLAKRRPFPTFALCPQCGFSGIQSQPGLAVSSLNTDPLKKLRPRHKRAVWIAALYQRG